MENKSEMATIMGPLQEQSHDNEGSLEENLGSQEGEYRLPKWQLVLLIIGLSLGLFMSFLDSSITATAIFTIGQEFHTLILINWIPLAYTLSDVGFAVLFTSLGDIIGRRNAYILSSVLFFSFSIACGFAQSITQLITLRALQGMGGSGLYSLAMVILPEICPQSMRRWIGAAVGIVVGTAGIMGPILGGIITNYASWRWIFWINAPISVISQTLFFIAWPKANQLRHAERRPLREVDILGSFLLMASSVLIVFSFQESGLSGNSWGEPIFLAPLVTGVVCTIILIAWEIIITKYHLSITALFPSSLFTRRVYVASALATLFTGFPYFIVIYNIPLHFQVVNGKSPLIAGLTLLPLLASTALGSMLSGVISRTRNNLFYTLTAGSCLLTLGTGLLSTVVDTGVVEKKIYGFQIFVGLGFGLTVSSSSIMAAVECQLKDHAIAQGTIAQSRVLGGSFGLAASTAILGLTLRRKLSSALPPSQISSLNFSSLEPTQLNTVKGAYGEAFREIMWIATVISGASVIWAIGSWRRNPGTLEARGKEQIEEEVRRLKLKSEQRVDRKS